MLVLVCCWRWIKVLISPQVIFCFPGMQNILWHWNHQVKARADHLSGASLWAVCGKLLKLLDTGLYLGVCSEPSAIDRYDGKKYLYLIQDRSVPHENPRESLGALISYSQDWKLVAGIPWRYHYHASREGLSPSKKVLVFRVPKAWCKAKSLLFLQVRVWEQLYQLEARMCLISLMGSPLEMGCWTLSSLSETAEWRIAPETNSVFLLVK